MSAHEQECFGRRAGPGTPDVVHRYILWYLSSTNPDSGAVQSVDKPHPRILSLRVTCDERGVVGVRRVRLMVLTATNQWAREYSMGLFPSRLGLRGTPVFRPDDTAKLSLHAKFQLAILGVSGQPLNLEGTLTVGSNLVFALKGSGQTYRSRLAHPVLPAYSGHTSLYPPLSSAKTFETVHRLETCKPERQLRTRRNG